MVKKAKVYAFTDRSIELGYYADTQTHIGAYTDADISNTLPPRTPAGGREHFWRMAKSCV